MTTLNLRAVAMISISVVIGGCGGVAINEVRQSLVAAKPCCSSLDAVQFSSLEAASRAKFEVTTSSPVLNTSEGLAYFVAFRLPSKVTRLEVQALNTEYLPKASYPDPLLLVLDSQHERIAEIKDLSLVRRRHTIIPGLYEYYYGAEVALPQNSQYILLFARPNSLRAQSAVSENGAYWAVPSAPVGTFAVVAR